MHKQWLSGNYWKMQNVIQQTAQTNNQRHLFQTQPIHYLLFFPLPPLSFNVHLYPSRTSLVGRVILTGIICPQTPMGSYLVNVRYSPSVEEHTCSTHGQKKELFISSFSSLELETHEKCHHLIYPRCFWLNMLICKWIHTQHSWLLYPGERLHFVSSLLQHRHVCNCFRS